MSFAAHAVVPVAVMLASEASRVPMPAPSAHCARARSVVSRIALREGDVREALETMLTALIEVEREVDDLRQRLALADGRVALKPELIRISPDGLSLQHELSPPIDGAVVVHLDLIVWGSRRLLALSGELTPGLGGTSIRWVDLSPEERDVLVGFVFQEQSRERRRALDDAGR